VRRLACLLLLFASTLTAAKNLEIYVIDVEGGKSVLFVAPSGQSMLFDAGWPASGTRQASNDRIVDAVHAAGLKRIDYLVISHFDIDHIGDVPALIAKVPVGHIFDHGDYKTTNAQARQRFDAYVSVREKVGHTVLKPGDKVPLRGVDVEVLSAGGNIAKKTGVPNSLCAANKQINELPADFEDNQSIGLLISLGKFRMLDLADLEAHHAHDLVCPNNLIGHVNVYNVNVHGQFKGIAPELVGALNAPVIIQANGARKGADGPTWPVLRAAPGLQNIWQLHYSLNAAKDTNPPDDYIANLESSDGFKSIQISATKSGRFTVTNTRNGFHKSY